MTGRALRRTRHQLRTRLRGSVDDGSAIIEFVFVALVVMVPLVYLIATVASVQRSQVAVAQAARDAGRAYATADSDEDARRRVDAAVRLAMANQNLPDDVEVRFVAAGDDCDATEVTPELRAGAEFAVCVSRRADLPGVPTVLAGRGVVTRAEYVIHVDDFRVFT